MFREFAVLMMDWDLKMIRRARRGIARKRSLPFFLWKAMMAVVMVRTTAVAPRPDWDLVK